MTDDKTTSTTQTTTTTAQAATPTAQAATPTAPVAPIAPPPVVPAVTQPVAVPPAPAVVTVPVDKTAADKLAAIEAKMAAQRERLHKATIRDAVKAAGLPDESLPVLAIPYDAAWFDDSDDLTDAGKQALNGWLAKVPASLKQIGGSTPGGGQKGVATPQAPEARHPGLAELAKKSPYAAMLLKQMAN
jgi:hypothetical protein